MRYTQIYNKNYNNIFNLPNYNYNNSYLYKKIFQKIRNSTINNGFFRLFNSTDNFDIILQKFKKSNKLENKGIENNKYNLLYNSTGSIKYKNYYNYKYKNNNNFSINKNSKKLQNLIDDVFKEIRDKKDIKDLKKYELKNRLSKIKSKIHYSHSVNKLYNNKNLKKNILTFVPNRFNSKKSKNANFNDLLNLCTKENLKNYSERKI